MSAIDFDDVPNWRGRTVIDQDGRSVGVITDLYLDEATHRWEWAAIKTGLFAHRVTFVPLSGAKLHGARVQVPYSQPHIHDAPNIDAEGHLEPEEEARLYRHYGLDDGPAGDAGSDSEFIAPATGERRSRLRRHEGG